MKTIRFFFIFLFISCLFSVTRAYSQQVFHKIYGGNDYDDGDFVSPTGDGGYMIIGYTETYGASPGSGDIYLIKVNSKGEIQWTKTIGGLSDEFSVSALPTADEGYLILRHSYSYSTTGFHDALLVKTDSMGNVQWARNYGLDNDESPEYVCLTNDGGYMITGNRFQVSTGDIFLLKVNSNGDTLWHRVYMTQPGKHEIVNYVQQTADGGYILTGHVEEANPVAGRQDLSLVKTDSNGTVQWAKAYGDTLQADQGYYVQPTADGGYMVLGVTGSFGAGKDDIVLIKTDGSGNVQWTKTYGGDDGDIFPTMRPATGGGYIIAGATYSFGLADRAAYLIRINDNGDVLWSKVYGADGNYASSLSVDQALDGGFVAVGDRKINNDWNIFLVKTDSFGNSGCLQADPNTIVTTPSMPQYEVTLTEIYAALYVDTPVLLIDSGGTDSTLCYADSIIAVKEVRAANKEFSVEVYPNPFSEKAIISIEYLRFNKEQELQFTLYDVLGQMAHQSAITDQQFAIYRNGLPAGIYFYTIHSGQRTVAGGKVVVTD